MKKSSIFIAAFMAFMVFAAVAYCQVKDISDQDFRQEVVSSPSAVIVEFWSPKCSHCLHMAKTVEALSNDLSGKAKVVRVNVLENRRMARKYGVQVVPTFLLFKDGDVAGNAVGEMDEKTLKKELGIASLSQGRAPNP